MRIAYVCADQGVPVFGHKGCSIHVQEVIRAFARQGQRVELFTPRPEGEPPPGLEAVPVHSLPRPAEKEAAARERAAVAANDALRAVLEREGPFDLVYERYSLWSFAGMEHAQAVGVPGLLEVNAPLIEEQAEHRTLVDRRAAEAVARRAFHAAAALIAVSAEVAEYLADFPGTRGRVHVIPNGIDPDRFPPGLRPPGPRDLRTFTVGFVGTLKPWHGLPTLVEAFTLLCQRHAEARLLIVGEGPERQRLEEDLSGRGLSGVAQLTGAVPPSEVPRLLAGMDAAVAPYPRLPRFYFSPLKVFEYMAAGLPVLASRLGQLEELIRHGINGLLCPPGDAGALAAALAGLCADPGLRQRLGEAARATVLRQHTWEAAVTRILRLAEAIPSPGLVAGGREVP
jgi:glycosyltransferase involved in cell wall biosynthesis